MAIYNYVASDNLGARRVGTVDARTEELAIALLKNQGMYVLSLTEKKSNILDLLVEIRGVPEDEVVNFTRQFSTMISAGLPISRALEILADQTANRKMKKILGDVLRDVEGGSSLSMSLGRYPRVFKTTYQALIRAGESSGKLDEILAKLATTMEANRELKAKFKAAMIYPAIVFMAMIGVFVIMMVFVIPKLAAMYESLNIELPVMTKAMIFISKLFTEKVYIIIGFVSAGIFGWTRFSKSETGKDAISYISFKLPVFGKINRQTDITQMTSTLGLLIASAVPIVESLKIVSDVVKNRSYKEICLEAARRVEKGSPLSEYFKANKNLPPLLGQMASVGEETGQLDQALEKVSDYFAGEVDHSVKGMSAALEPIILILLGSMVGVLIISIITPIYKITSSL